MANVADYSTLDARERAVLRCWRSGIRDIRGIRRITGHADSDVRRMLGNLRDCGLIESRGRPERVEPEPTDAQVAERERRARLLFFAKRFHHIGPDELLPPDVLDEILPDGGSARRQRERRARLHAARARA